MTTTRVARVRARLVPHRWTWADANEDAVAANFARRQALKPAIFNGPVLMVAALRAGGDTLHADFFRTDYARLMAHIDLGRPDGSVQNGFAMGALRAADGAFLLGEMGAHTAHAGQLYFPAGTPDPDDVTPDATVDLEGSIRREVAEETGIALAPHDLSPGWIVIDVDGRLAFLREIHLAADAESVRRRVLDHLAGEGSPELADLRIVRSPSEIDPDRMPGYLVAYLTAAFAAGPAQG